MFVFIGCAGGMSSSMFCQSIEKASRKSSLKICYNDLDSVISQHRGLAEENDIILAYGGINAIRPHTAFDFGRAFDVVFVAPQMRFLTQAKREILADFPVIVRDLDMRIFGKMDGENALTGLLDELINIDIERGYASEKGFSNKCNDKNMEIIIIGGDRNEIFFKEFTSALRERDMRILEESYSLETLYDIRPKDDYDLRLLYGVSELISKKDFPKIVRRIDLVILAASYGFMAKKGWFLENKIPVIELDNTNYLKGEGRHELNRIEGDIINASIFTEINKDVELKGIDEEPVERRKSFGPFSWI